MEEKIFLEKNRNIESINRENSMEVSLAQKARLLPYDNVSDTLNLGELFTAERDACGRYRLIFTVNPICTNVLYNNRTEIVYREGASDCVSLLPQDGYNSTVFTQNACNTTPLNNEQAIRDTEYSHSDVGGFVYHCGIDIFNNHMLRSIGFSHINKLNSTTKGTCGRVFNTISDYQRDADGNRINEVLNNSTNINSVYVHQYQLDNVIGLEEAYEKHMTEKDGWYGFKNVGFMEILNGGSAANISINKLINNNKACEFIDMYPDRSLFSFIPKRNKYRNRNEYNWDYCITYPYKSDYDKLASAMSITVSGAKQRCPGYLKAHAATGKSENGDLLYVFKTVINHNLKYGDKVRLTNTHGDRIEIRIAGVGDVDGTDKERCFRVYASQLTIGVYDEYIWVKKISNGVPCDYYFRVFKKIKNNDGTDLNSTIGKLAFGENIYGDRMAEVVYTDDINVDGLRDNLGRKVSELFFTVIKANRGHKEWYDDDDFTSDKIEASHCFGKVTSGLKLIDDEEDYNVTRLHNVSYNDIGRGYKTGFGKVFGRNMTPPDVLEDDITINDDEFYGDVVEFDPSMNMETVLGNVYHRFNTAQRETTNTSYYDIVYDRVISDDYEIGVQGAVGQSIGFSAQPETLNVYDGDDFPGNIQPEGYYYKPHNRIRIRKISDKLNSEIGALITTNRVRTLTSITKGDSNEPLEGDYIEVYTSDNYGYILGDLFGINKNGKLGWGLVEKFEKIDNEIRIILELVGGLRLSEINSDCEFILTDGNLPTYASYIPSEQKFVWRDVLLPSEVTNDEELSEMMFTNGANYIHSNVTFFLKRQDPFGKNGLSVQKRDINGKDINPLGKFKRFGYALDLSKFIYFGIEAENACL